MGLRGQTSSVSTPGRLVPCGFTAPAEVRYGATLCHFLSALTLRGRMMIEPIQHLDQDRGSAPESNRQEVGRQLPVLP